MLVIVHTLTMTLGDLEVNAVFYHGLEKQKRDLKISLLKRRFAFKRLKGWNKKPFYRQKLSAFGYKHERELIENVFNRKRFLPQVSFSAKDEGSPPHDPPTPPSSPKQKVVVYNSFESQENNGVCSSWGPQQTAMWLQSNRYVPHMQTLSSYSGADLLRLSKENLIQLCGLPDGIRLHNALHAKCILPKLTLYICVDLRERVYQVVYLNLLTRSELLSKISNVLGLVSSQISSAYVLGPNGIKLLMTDQLVAHMTDHSAYAINMAQDGSDRYQLLFKLTENTAPA